MMTSLREYFGMFETFTNSQKWVVDQLKQIFPYHDQYAVEAVVGFETERLDMSDSQVLLQQCTNFILDQSSILETATAEYTQSLEGYVTGVHKSNEIIRRKQQDIDFKNFTVIVDSDDDVKMDVAKSQKTNVVLPNTNQMLFTDSDFKDRTKGSEFKDIIKASKFIHNKFSSHDKTVTKKTLPCTITKDTLLQSEENNKHFWESNQGTDFMSSDTSTTNFMTTDSSAINAQSSFINSSSVTSASTRESTNFNLKKARSIIPSTCCNSVNGIVGPLSASPVFGKVTMFSNGGVSVAGSGSNCSTPLNVGTGLQKAFPSSAQDNKGNISVTMVDTDNHFKLSGVNNNSKVQTGTSKSEGFDSSIPTQGEIFAEKSGSQQFTSPWGQFISQEVSQNINQNSFSSFSSPDISLVNSNPFNVNTMPEYHQDSVAEEVEKLKHEVIQLFPDVEPTYVTDLLRLHFGPDSVNNVCNVLLEHPNYPRIQKANKNTQKEKISDNSVDYFKDYDHIDCTYSKEVCEKLLQNEFQKVSVKDITVILRRFNGHYAPTYKAFFDAMEQAYNNTDPADLTAKRMAPKQIEVKVEQNGTTSTEVFNLLKGKRPMKLMPALNNQLESEICFVKKKLKTEKEEADKKYAWQLNENEYEDNGQLIECNCCYGEHTFESMVQCYEGHLFCTECLLNYAKEAVYGSGKLGLACMATDCESNFPMSEMKRCLPEKLLNQYEERIRESNLNQANLEDLVRCPHCDYAAIIAVGDKVFRCENQTCKRETCRYCKEDWKDHIGIPCNELEKEDESKLRKQYEEKMTQAKIRQCHRCKNKFTKDGGCNKMMCTCRATMCYICRKPDIDYNHFCGHPREPGETCKKCKACSLWTNPDEDDNRAIKEIQEEANQKRMERGYDEKKLIGAPIEPPSKKRKH